MANRLWRTDWRVALGAVLLAAATGILLATLPTDDAPMRAARTMPAPSPEDTGSVPMGHTAQAVDETAPLPQPEPSSGPAISLLVRDLADGSTVAHLAFSIGGTVNVSSDRNGFLVVPAEGEGRLAPVGPEWRATHSPGDGAPEGPRTLWVYRLIPVRGRVFARPGSPPPDLRRVEVSGVLAMGRASEPEPWNTPWIAKRGIEFTHALASPDSNGDFTGTLPRIRGLTVLATCAGYRPASQRLALDFTVDEVRPRLELLPVLRVRGTLRTVDGTPLAKEHVRAYSIIRVPKSDLDPFTLQLLQPRGGFTAHTEKGGDDAIASFRSGANADAHGEFELEVGVQGRTTLVVFPIGRPPALLDLGSLASDRIGVELIVGDPIAPIEVTLLEDGEPLAGRSVVISDLSRPSGDYQPAFTADLDGKGVLRTTWLTPGRTYNIGVLATKEGAKSRSGVIVWEGQEIIDVGRDLTKLK